MKPPLLSERGRTWLKNSLVLLFLAAILWVARYWHFTEFGLYEDDLTLIPKLMEMSGSQYLSLLIEHLSILYPHGRPLHNSFIYTFAFLGTGDGLRDLYLFGFVITAINIFLFYALLKRLFDHSFALVGGIAFALFSADTTQAFLTASFGIHPSMTFLLLALHSYLSSRRLLAYILGVLILFTYEAPYLVLLAAPLLSMRWDKKLIREALINAVILFVLILGVYEFRSAVGEFRGVGLTVPKIITTSIVHMIQGSIVAMGTYLYRPVQALSAIDIEIFTASVGAFILFNIVLSRSLPERWEGIRDFLNSLRQLGLSSIPNILRTRDLPLRIPHELDRLLKLAVAGGFMLVLAYPLTFTVRAYAISGRETRGHFAAVVGAAMLWACVGWMLLAIGESYRRRQIVVALLSGLFALLVGFGFIIQRDYVDAWKYQQEFWTELTQLIPDVEEGTVVLVEHVGLKSTLQIGANTWNLPRVLDQIYTFPSEWENPPRVYRLLYKWRRNIVGEDGLFVLDQTTTMAPTPFYRNVPSTDVIFIETATGDLKRRTEPLELDGELYTLYPNSTIVHQFEKNFLYDYFILR